MKHVIKTFTRILLLVILSGLLGSCGPSIELSNLDIQSRKFFERSFIPELLFKMNPLSKGVQVPSSDERKQLVDLIYKQRNQLLYSIYTLLSMRHQLLSSRLFTNASTLGSTFDNQILSKVDQSYGGEVTPELKKQLVEKMKQIFSIWEYFLTGNKKTVSPEFLDIETKIVEYLPPEKLNACDFKRWIYSDTPVEKQQIKSVSNELSEKLKPLLETVEILSGKDNSSQNSYLAYLSNKINILKGNLDSISTQIDSLSKRDTKQNIVQRDLPSKHKEGTSDQEYFLYSAYIILVISYLDPILIGKKDVSAIAPGNYSFPYYNPISKELIEPQIIDESNHLLKVFEETYKRIQNRFVNYVLKQPITEQTIDALASSINATQNDPYFVELVKENQFVSSLERLHRSTSITIPWIRYAMEIEDDLRRLEEIIGSNMTFLIDCLFYLDVYKDILTHMDVFNDAPSPSLEPNSSGLVLAGNPTSGASLDTTPSPAALKSQNPVVDELDAFLMTDDPKSPVDKANTAVQPNNQPCSQENGFKPCTEDASPAGKDQGASFEALMQENPSSMSDCARINAQYENQTLGTHDKMTESTLPIEYTNYLHWYWFKYLDSKDF